MRGIIKECELESYLEREKPSIELIFYWQNYVYHQGYENEWRTDRIRM